MSSHESGASTQQRIIDTIRTLHRDLGYWPSQLSVRTALGLPRSTARYHIRILEDDGKIERLEHGRMLRPVPANEAAS